MIFAASLVSLCGFNALVIDLGTARVSRAQLEMASEAAALAGATYMDGSSEGLKSAEQVALAVGRLNSVNGIDDSMAGAEVEFGVISDGEFVVETNPANAEAIRVLQEGVSVNTFFGRVFGKNSLDVSARGIAMRESGSGVGSGSCALPLAIPDCLLTDYTQDELNEMEFSFSSDGEDTIGWADPTNANASNTQSALDRWLTDDCDDDVYTVDDSINVKNGVQASSLSHLATVMTQSGQVWQEDLWGEQPDQHSKSHLTKNEYGSVIAGPVVVFDAGGADCSSVKYNQDKTVVGFTWVVVYDVHKNEGGKNGKKQGIRARVDTENIFDWGDKGGGLETNLEYTTPPTLIF